MTQFFRIKNWSSFQSYKDRNPPWIRFHKSTLDDYAFQKMSVEARALLPMLWLIASEDSNPVTGLIRIGYEGISFRLRRPENELKQTIREILLAGFLIEISLEESISYESVTKVEKIRKAEERREETESEKRQRIFLNKKSKGTKNEKPNRAKAARDAALSAIPAEG